MTDANLTYYPWERATYAGHSTSVRQHGRRPCSRRQGGGRRHRVGEVAGLGRERVDAQAALQ